ncbi:Ribosomal RNA large subunit methyltransferase [Trichinella spiralis]|uniref:Ribosomal RNA large subunit methyltransferase n=1 Tax=Trichinella spiralis TaxID=6334 RepID=A0ABR3L0W9_TRISP
MPRTVYVKNIIHQHHVSSPPMTELLAGTHGSNGVYHTENRYANSLLSLYEKLDQIYQKRRCCYTGIQICEVQDASLLLFFCVAGKMNRVYAKIHIELVATFNRLNDEYILHYGSDGFIDSASPCPPGPLMRDLSPANEV